jgi:ATP-dependent Lon protease
VRNLERELSSLIRKAVKELTLHNKQSITVEANTVADYLGVPKLRSLAIDRFEPTECRNYFRNSGYAPT